MTDATMVTMFWDTTDDGRVVRVGRGVTGDGTDAYMIGIDSHHGETKIALTPATLETLINLKKVADDRKERDFRTWRLVWQVQDILAPTDTAEIKHD